ncbi:hypothetical protein SCOR_22200 [Sulfidibacter corallicola]
MYWNNHPKLVVSDMEVNDDRTWISQQPFQYPKR